MKNVYEVLRQKENDAERVRKEIKALMIVIPLIAGVPESDVLNVLPESDVLNALMIDSSQRPIVPADHRLDDLKRYYPFVRHLRGE